MKWDPAPGSRPGALAPPAAVGTDGDREGSPPGRNEPDRSRGAGDEPLGGTNCQGAESAAGPPIFFADYREATVEDMLRELVRITEGMP